MLDFKQQRQQNWCTKRPWEKPLLSIESWWPPGSAFPFALDFISISSSTARAASLWDLQMRTCLISRHLSELNSKSQWSSNISCTLSSFPRNHRSDTLNYTSRPHWAKKESEMLRFNAFSAAMTKNGDDIWFCLESWEGRKDGEKGKREETVTRESWQLGWDGSWGWNVTNRTWGQERSAAAEHKSHILHPAQITKLKNKKSEAYTEIIQTAFFFFVFQSTTYDCVV